MTGPDPTLNTRWSMLEGLGEPRAEDSWRWFIDRYRTYIRTGLGRLIQPEERARQATEEIWSYLFTSSIFANADRGRRFRTYLAGTIRNFALDWLRRNPLAGDPTAAVEVADFADPSTQFEEQDMRLWKQQVVQLALTALAHRHPEQVDVLRWFYGLPASIDAEPGAPRPASWIAARLGIQANAVHQIVFRGRKRLRSCIENELRETVRDQADLDDEMRLIYAVIEAENPGLEA